MCLIWLCRFIDSFDGDDLRAREGGEMGVREIGNNGSERWSEPVWPRWGMRLDQGVSRSRTCLCAEGCADRLEWLNCKLDWDLSGTQRMQGEWHGMDKRGKSERGRAYGRWVRGDWVDGAQVRVGGRWVAIKERGEGEGEGGLWGRRGLEGQKRRRGRKKESLREDSLVRNKLQMRAEGERAETVGKRVPFPCNYAKEISGSGAATVCVSRQWPTADSRRQAADNRQTGEKKGREQRAQREDRQGLRGRRSTD